MAPRGTRFFSVLKNPWLDIHSGGERRDAGQLCKDYVQRPNSSIDQVGAVDPHADKGPVSNLSVSMLPVSRSFLRNGPDPCDEQRAQREDGGGRDQQRHRRRSDKGRDDAGGGRDEATH